MKRYTYKKTNKHWNKPTFIDWIRFMSKSEAKYFCFAKDRQAQWIIQDLILQPKFVIQEKFERNWEKFRSIDYVADFQFTRYWKKVVVDVKGDATAEAKMKRKMFLKQYPDLELERVVEYQWVFVEYFANIKRRQANKKAKTFIL